MEGIKKKYFWLKLDRNFFKRHDISIVESMENGKDYVLFYLKLLVESIDHEGDLRFSETIPYNDKMLATITNTNIDIVRSAIKVFKELGLIQILDDQTIYMTEVQKMLGESSSKHRVQAFRERQKQLETSCNVTQTLHVTEIELEKDIDIDKDKYINNIYSGSENHDESFCEESLQSKNDNNNLVEDNEQQKQKQKEIINNNKLVFDYWNSKNIIVHKTLSEELNNTITKFLKKYTLEQAKEMIARYKQVLDDEKYFFSYVWSLKDFLNRKNGAVDFADDGSKWQDYCNKTGNKTLETKEIEEGVFRL